jgi:hypothetical protein
MSYRIKIHFIISFIGLDDSKSNYLPRWLYVTILSSYEFTLKYRLF